MNAIEAVERYKAGITDNPEHYKTIEGRTQILCSLLGLQRKIDPRSTDHMDLQRRIDYNAVRIIDGINCGQGIVWIEKQTGLSLDDIRNIMKRNEIATRAFSRA